MSKTFEGASRADAQSIDPLKLCLIGGRALPKDEQGPLDTDPDPSHRLYKHDLLKPLDPRDVESVFQNGVIVPIEVVRGPNDVPLVNLGAGRVRKARLANIRRKAEGLPLIEVKFTVVRLTDGLALLRRQIDENLRRKDVGVLDRIELAKRMLVSGASEKETADYFEVTLARFKSWLSIEDDASPSVREALKQDRLKPSAAMVLVELGDHAAQDEKLAELLTAKPTARAARKLVRSAKGKAEVVRPKLPQQKLLLERVGKHVRGNEWMQGAKAALAWVTGESAHKDLRELLEEDDETSPKKTREKE